MSRTARTIVLCVLAASLACGGADAVTPSSSEEESAAAPAAAQAPPGTDVWIAELDLSSHPPTIGAARNATARAGYDNQPFFEPEGDGLLITAQHEGQTDIYRIDLASGAVQQLTDTPESEYSPTVTPDGATISVIRVEADGTQRLWGFDRDGASPRLLFENVAPVGYQAWNERDVVMFVLGEPPTLQRIPVGGGEPLVIAHDIGRSLHRMPPESDFTFVQREGDGFMIRILDAVTGEVHSLAPALAASTDQDMAWTPDGRVLMAAGSRLFVLDRFPDDHWVQVADLEDAGVRNITRLAVHPEGTKLALVAEDG